LLHILPTAGADMDSEQNTYHISTAETLKKAEKVDLIHQQIFPIKFPSPN